MVTFLIKFIFNEQDYNATVQKVGGGLPVHFLVSKIEPVLNIRQPYFFTFNDKSQCLEFGIDPNDGGLAKIICLEIINECNERDIDMKR